MLIIQRALGIILIVLGVALMAFSLYELLLKLFLAAFGLWVVNYGLKIAGQPSLGLLITRWVAFRRFF